MKKKILTLMAFAAVFAASPVFAMENEHVSNLSAKKKFAVVNDYDLKVSPILNYHAEIGGDQPRFLKTKNLFGFEIKTPEEKNGFVAFPVNWQNVQYYTRDFDRVGSGGIYPWNCLAGRPEKNRYRVVEYFEGVVCVDTNKNPYAIEDENAYYSANIYKALPRSKTLWLHDASGSTVSWILDGTYDDFTLSSLQKKIRKEIESGEWENTDAEREQAYQQKITDQSNELNKLVKEALAKK